MINIENLELDAREIGLFICKGNILHNINANTKIKFYDKDGYFYSFSRSNVDVTKKRKGTPCTFFNYNPYTFENINHYFEINNISVKLLTKNPQNATCDLEFLCVEHNEIFVRTWNTVKNGVIGCRKCPNSHVHRYTIDLAKKVISEKGKCELVSNEWNGNKSEYVFECKCGNQFTRRFDVVITQGNDRCGECTGITKHTTDTVKLDLEQYGISILSDYISNSRNIKIQYPCGYVANRSYTNIIKSEYKCPHCNKQGYGTTSESFKELVSNITNKEYTVIGDYTTLTDLIEFKHNICGHHFTTSPRSFIKRNTRCPFCSDGLSYPEKFIFSLLEVLKVDFTHDKYLPWSNTKRYDFYISSLDMIIETHGIQHYNGGFCSYGGRTLSEEQENDRYKEKIARGNGIQHYIVIDCRKSELEWIKQSIESSKLAELFDLSIVNFEKIHKKSLSSKCIEACELYNTNKNIEYIAAKLNISKDSVKNYLKKGSDIGLCIYKRGRINGKRSSI